MRILGFWSLLLALLVNLPALADSSGASTPDLGLGMDPNG